MSEDPVTITPLENGPYLIKGPVTVLDADWVRVPGRAGDHRPVPLRRVDDQAVL